MRRGAGLAAMRNDLHAWGQYSAPWVCLGLAAGAAELAIAHPSGHSVLRQALGGPAVTVVNGQFRVAPGWTWLVVGVLFVVAAAVLADQPVEWTYLTLARGVSPRAWAAARLAALGLGAGAYLASLVVLMAATVLLGHSGPLVRATSLWDIGLWAIGLVSLGWFVFALMLTTGRQWTGVVVPMALLSCARFGGNLSPYTPFAQWMVGFHGLPGTLSVAAGTGYVLIWLVLCAAAVLLAAESRLRAHE